VTRDRANNRPYHHFSSLSFITTFHHHL